MKGNLRPHDHFGPVIARLKSVGPGANVILRRGEVEELYAKTETSDPFGYRGALKKILDDGQGVFFGRLITIQDQP